jgi:hypothetical protein
VVLMLDVLVLFRDYIMSFVVGAVFFFWFWSWIDCLGGYGIWLLVY